MNLIKAFAYLSVSLFLISCTDDFSDINTNTLKLDTKKIGDNEKLLGMVFSQAQYSSVYAISGNAWRFQIAQNLFADIWCQYFATTAKNFDSDRYVQVGRWADLGWSSFYEESAPQIKFVEDATKKSKNNLANAMAKIWKVYSYHRVTDYWGPIPYSEFGNQKNKVKYDTQEDIYTDFFKQLDTATDALKTNLSKKAFTSGDKIYSGDASKWLKFANSLRLRLSIRIRFVDPTKAKTEAEKAFTDGLIINNSDNAAVATDVDNRNPLAVITDWKEFRMSAAMESILKGYNDPRVSYFFNTAVKGDSDGDGDKYEGLLNGQTKSELAKGLNDDYSDLATRFLNLSKGGTNPHIVLIRASEVFFLRAEAALLGWNMGGTPKELYEKGIKASMKEITKITDSEIDNYIKSNAKPVAYESGKAPLTDIPIAFDDAGDTEKKLEQIITQKWIAIYPDGWEAWAELRRTGYPKQYARVSSENTDVPADKIIRRMVYVSGEFNNNKEAVNEAISKLNGGDKNNTKLWWDKKN